MVPCDRYEGPTSRVLELRVCRGPAFLFRGTGMFLRIHLMQYINVNYRKNKYIRNFFSTLPSLTPRLARPLTALPISSSASARAVAAAMDLVRLRPSLLAARGPRCGLAAASPARSVAAAHPPGLPSLHLHAV